MNLSRNIILSLAIISLAGLLSSCNSIQSTFTGHPESRKTNKIKEGETGVCVLRADTAFYNTPFLSVDGKPFGGINSSSYLFGQLSPGLHQLAIHQGYFDGTLHYQFQVKSGQVTYLNMAWGKIQKQQQASPSTNSMFASTRGWVIVSMNEQIAKSRLNELRAESRVNE